MRRRKRKNGARSGSGVADDVDDDIVDDADGADEESLTPNVTD
jgi:hypothetical protein